MRKILALVLALCMVFALAACGSETSEPSEAPVSEAPASEAPESEAPASEEPAADPQAAAEAVIASLTVPEDIDPAAVQGVEDGVLTVAMECAYAPYNWTQIDDSNGGVPISNMSGSYANGYDVMISKIICDLYGWDLEVVSSAWDSLVPGVQSGIYDAVIAGQSMTADRMSQVDMAGPYYYADIVVVTTKDSEYANATSIADLAGGTATAQSGTIWSDVPTATAAAQKDDNLVILNFAGTDGDFQFATEAERAENVNIGISVQKGNTTLLDAMNAVLSQMDADDFNTIMAYAISVQPEI